MYMYALCIGEVRGWKSVELESVEKTEFLSITDIGFGLNLLD